MINIIWSLLFDAIFFAYFWLIPDNRSIYPLELDLTALHPSTPFFAISGPDRPPFSEQRKPKLAFGVIKNVEPVVPEIYSLPPTLLNNVFYVVSREALWYSIRMVFNCEPSPTVLRIGRCGKSITFAHDKLSEPLLASLYHKYIRATITNPSDRHYYLESIPISDEIYHAFDNSFKSYGILGQVNMLHQKFLACITDVKVVDDMLGIYQVSDVVYLPMLVTMPHLKSFIPNHLERESKLFSSIKDYISGLRLYFSFRYDLFNHGFTAWNSETHNGKGYFESDCIVSNRFKYVSNQVLLDNIPKPIGLEENNENVYLLFKNYFVPCIEGFLGSFDHTHKLLESKSEIRKYILVAKSKTTRKGFRIATRGVNPKGEATMMYHIEQICFNVKKNLNPVKNGVVLCSPVLLQENIRIWSSTILVGSIPLIWKDCTSYYLPLRDILIPVDRNMQLAPLRSHFDSLLDEYRRNDNYSDGLKILPYVLPGESLLLESLVREYGVIYREMFGLPSKNIILDQPCLDNDIPEYKLCLFNPEKKLQQREIIRLSGNDCTDRTLFTSFIFMRKVLNSTLDGFIDPPSELFPKYNKHWAGLLDQLSYSYTGTNSKYSKAIYYKDNESAPYNSAAYRLYIDLMRFFIYALYGNVKNDALAIYYGYFSFHPLSSNVIVKSRNYVLQRALLIIAVALPTIGRRYFMLPEDYTYKNRYNADLIQQYLLLVLASFATFCIWNFPFDRFDLAYYYPNDYYPPIQFKSIPVPPSDLLLNVIYNVYIALYLLFNFLLSYTPLSFLVSTAWNFSSSSSVE